LEVVLIRSNSVSNMIYFSIFLPVHNGMPYIQECVQHILDQSYGYFELHILDNYSTDGTIEWLKTLSDPRIRLSFSSKKLTIVESWGRIKHLPKKEFVTLIGHDDILDKYFLEVISRLIIKYPDAALYKTCGRLIDSGGRRIRDCRPVPVRETASGYLSARFAFVRDISGTGYVMRSADYDRLGGIPPFERLFFADDVLWLSVMCRSYQVSDPAVHFAVRIHPGSESATMPSAWRSILVGLDQLSDFLRHYRACDDEVRSVIDRHSPNFYLVYHRNVLTLALIEASQDGKRISPEAVVAIEISLAHCAPTVARELWKSPLVTVLRLVNATSARGLIPVLWRQYHLLKNKA
jgi:glycosyltransferase involved in cell wall biosynthesis